ncbi:TIM barrel protein [Zhihengliuella flava]|uniref:Hydroxypyruvate isomerase n=1 Tax=Zhihengliuella flava TaxID=1285193 RepID=A0A931D5Y8_9MICC|nr:TIM barrel protein [Zhihengliuella flava]MBG6084325.1 hydroxypyruvate isomerase [Zhihengliuella flava]
MSYRLAACAEMLFLDRPIVDRVRALDERGFEVEIWDWSGKDLPALAATGATFSSMTGYLRGDLITERGQAELIATARDSLAAAEVLDVPRLNLHGTGLGPDGLPVTPGERVSGGDWIRAADTLRRLGDLALDAGRTFMLENLNRAVDHPGTPFARAADTLELISAVDHPGVRLNLDLYHAQIGEGNLLSLVDRALPWVGEFQIADVPGRCEPGTGEIRYPAIAAALARHGYTGVIGLEGFASGDPEQALEAFREAFA